MKNSRLQNTVAISKETFVNTLDKIQTERARIEKINDALDEICDGYPVIMAGNGYLEALLDVLNEVFGEENDQYPTIDWWLFEDVPKVITILPEHHKNSTGEEINVDVSTPERLYDYLINY